MQAQYYKATEHKNSSAVKISLIIFFKKGGTNQGGKGKTLHKRGTNFA